MGKIKTVVMGDLEAEEAARQKAEAKREQKRARRVPSEVEGTTEVNEEVKEEKKKTKTAESRYIFPRGKRYNQVRTLVEKNKLYPTSETFELVKKTSYSKFDGAVELHFNVTEKNLRGNVTLPHGTGKQLRVKIADEALIANPVIDFDILVATPEMMPKLAKIAKILGPRGLMPNPKTNTISEDPEKLVKTLSSSVSWKTQPDFPIIHATIGKVSWEVKKLAENFAALTKSIGKDKIVSVFAKATMGPTIRVQS